jgi:hypothetical protein
MSVMQVIKARIYSNSPLLPCCFRCYLRVVSQSTTKRVSLALILLGIAFAKTVSAENKPVCCRGEGSFVRHCTDTLEELFMFNTTIVKLADDFCERLVEVC